MDVDLSCSAAASSGLTLASNAFKENGLKFPVAEFLDIHFTGRNTKPLCNLGGEIM